MKNQIKRIAGLIVGLMLLCSTDASPPTQASPIDALRIPVSVIFDTDIWGDFDDALALAMLHALQDRGEANLLAVTLSTDDEWCASYVDLVDAFYGHPQVPVGIVHAGVDVRKSHPDWVPSSANFTQLLSERKKPDGSRVYSRHLIPGHYPADAVSVLRKALASQPDQSVVMIQVGYSTNYSRLLESKPDGVSSMGGRDLIKKKVRLLSVMAGTYADYHVAGVTCPKGGPEPNLMLDVSAAQKMFSAWPTPIVASGAEVGVQMVFPDYAFEHYFAYAQNHPIAEAHQLFVEWLGVKFGHPQYTCDLTAVLYAVRPDANYFLLSKPGKITVLSGGASRFDESETGMHRHLILSEDEKSRTLEAMVMLASQPPVAHSLDKTQDVLR